MKMAVEMGASQRGSCRILDLNRATAKYKRRPEDPVNVLVRDELRRLSWRHKRYGSPRMTALIRRQGLPVNHKRIERIWRQEALSVPLRKRRRKRRSPSLERPKEATRPNEVWSYDFISDKTELGQKLKMLTVVDEFSRECLEIRVEKRMRSGKVLETLDELMTERGTPTYTTSNNGPKFIAKQLEAWLKSNW